MYVIDTQFSSLMFGSLILHGVKNAPCTHMYVQYRKRWLLGAYAYKFRRKQFENFTSFVKCMRL